MYTCVYIKSGRKYIKVAGVVGVVAVVKYVYNKKIIINYIYIYKLYITILHNNT